MNILQISAPKSGSYWLHSILLQIFQKKEWPVHSFIQEQEIYRKAKDMDLSFNGQAGVDMMDVEEDGCYFRISSVFREKVEDVVKYADKTSLAWTHSTFCMNSLKVFPLFDKKVCIVRDPRDRALSSAKFAFTPYMQKHYPTSYNSPEEYLEGEYERLLDQWVWFTGNYMLHKEELDVHFVFYERLLEDFPAEFRSLLKYLEVELRENEQREIEEAVHFSSLKDKSPKHLNKGKYGKWLDQLDEARQETAIERAGSLMQWLNYPLKADEQQDRLPCFPDKVPEKELEELLGEMAWQELF